MFVCVNIISNNIFRSPLKNNILKNKKSQNLPIVFHVSPLFISQLGYFYKNVADYEKIFKITQNTQLSKILNYWLFFGKFIIVAGHQSRV